MININDYNFIISNLIISQKTKFTYDDIYAECKKIYGIISEDVKIAINKCLIRLREDGFLNVLGSYYWVSNINFE